jgi:membrane fusion protein (multidrug efflux system)
MPADTTLDSPPAGTTAPPTTRRAALQAQDWPAGMASIPVKASWPPRQRRVRWALFALLPFALIGGAYWYITGGQVMPADDAYVNSETVGISTDVAGIVQQIAVTENQHVDAGQVLDRLDPRQFQIALDNAMANQTQTALIVASMKQDYRRMLSEVAARQAQVALDQATYDRKAALVPVEEHPQFLQATAQVDEAQRRLDGTIVKAPFAGIVTNVSSIAPGKYLGTSTTAFYLVASDHVWVDATPKETELTYERPGQPVTVTVDAYPDAVWHGIVESFSPAAAQQFSLLPAQNTSGNWVKVVQRIPMRVRVDTIDKNLPPLRTGMSAEVDVDTGHARGLPHFLAALFGLAPRVA